MVLHILQYGHPLLREVSTPVIHITDEIRNLLIDMEETLKQGGIGLAAPQVGFSLQLVTINIPPTEESTTWLEIDGHPATLADIMPLNFINPNLFPFGKKVSYKEGCLSIAKVYADVKRRQYVKGTLTLIDGRTIHIKCNGLLARCLQHETDHLHGGLFTDLVDDDIHDKVIRRLKLTHPDAFEEADHDYALRMKEQRRQIARQQAETPPPHPSVSQSEVPRTPDRADL